MVGDGQKWLARITKHVNLGQFWSISIKKSSHRFSRSLSQLPTTVNDSKQGFCNEVMTMEVEFHKRTVGMEHWNFKYHKRLTTIMEY